MVNEVIQKGQAMAVDPVAFTKEQVDSLFDEALSVGDNTKADYKLRIGEFLDFVAENGMAFNTLMKYREHLEKKTEWTASTKNKYFNSAKAYCGILYTMKLIPMDIRKDLAGKNVKAFKQTQQHKKDGIQPEEMERLTTYFKSLSPDPKNLRLKAIFSLLIYQGLRQVEIVRFDVSDIDLKKGTAMVLGKGRDDKERIDLHPYTVEALKAYLKAYNKKSGALFTCLTVNKDQRLSTRALRKLVKNILDKLGIENSTHGFRHYFTTNLIAHYQGDLLAVTHYTRHKSIAMLQIYNDELKAEQDLPRYVQAFEGVQL